MMLSQPWTFILFILVFVVANIFAADATQWTSAVNRIAKGTAISIPANAPRQQGLTVEVENSFLSKGEGVKSISFLILAKAATSIETIIHLKRSAAQLATNAVELSDALSFTPEDTKTSENTSYRTAAGNLIVEMINEWDRFPGTPWKQFSKVLSTKGTSKSGIALKRKGAEHAKTGKDLISALTDYGGTAGIPHGPFKKIETGGLVRDSFSLLTKYPELEWTDLSKLLEMPIDDDTRIKIKRLGAKNATTVEGFIGALTDSSFYFLEEPSQTYLESNDALLREMAESLNRFSDASTVDYLQLAQASTDKVLCFHIKNLAFKYAKTPDEATLALTNTGKPRAKVDYYEENVVFAMNNAVALAQRPKTEISHVLSLIRAGTPLDGIMKIKNAALPLVKSRADLQKIIDHIAFERIKDKAWVEAHDQFTAKTEILFKNAFLPGIDGKLLRPVSELGLELGPEPIIRRRPEPISVQVREPKDLISRFYQLAGLFKGPETNGEKRAIRRIIREVPKLFLIIPDMYLWMQFEIMMGIKGTDRIHLRTKLAETTTSASDLKLLMPGPETDVSEGYWKDYHQELADTILRIGLRRFPNDTERLITIARNADLLEMYRAPTKKLAILNPTTQFLVKLPMRTGFRKSIDKYFPVRLVGEDGESVTVISEKDFMDAQHLKMNVPIFRISRATLLENRFPELDPYIKENLALSQAELKPIDNLLIPPQIRIRKGLETLDSTIRLLYFLREQFKGIAPLEAVNRSEQCLAAFTKTLNRK